MLFYIKLKNLYHKLILSKYIIAHNYRIPSNYNDTSTQFKGNYLFHSIIYNLDNTVRDGRLGYKISDGCIRLAKVNAKWIYDNIPYGTTVFIS